MTKVPDDHPLKVAFDAWAGTEEHANVMHWAGQPGQDPAGTVWAAFMAGFAAAGGKITLDS